MKYWNKWLALVLAMLLMTGAALADEAADYETAMALYEAEKFEEAIPAFEALGKYKDSQKMLANSKWYWKEQRYDNAVALYKAEDFEAAKLLFEELGSFEESKQYVNKCLSGITQQTYDRANALYAEGQLEAARVIFEELGSFKKSKDLLSAIDAELAAQALAAYEQECWDKAVALKAEGKLAEARDMFVQAAGMEGATDEIYAILDVLAKEEVYARAELDLRYNRLQDAAVRFETLGDYQDSASRAAEVHQAMLAQRYQEAAEAEDKSRAYIIFLALGDYEDSASQAEALKPETGLGSLFQAARQLDKEYRYQEAAAGYAQCENYNESDKLAKEARQNAENAAQFERAHILTDLWQLEEANAIYKSLGNYSYAQRMGIDRLSAKQLRDDATTPCSEVFTAPDGSRHIYRMYKGVPRWVEAEAFCRALGGHMATITTPEENAFVHAFMWDSGHTTAYFGLEDEERDHTWEWVTGEPVEYTNWHRGEPSYSGRERYGMYFYKHTTGEWNDAHFYEHWEDPGCSYICEWDLD